VTAALAARRLLCAASRHGGMAIGRRS